MVENSPVLITSIVKSIVQRDDHSIMYSFKVCYHDIMELRVLKEHLVGVIKDMGFPLEQRDGINER